MKLQGKKGWIGVAIGYTALTAGLLALCVLNSGCASTRENDDWFDDWVHDGTKRFGAKYQDFRGTECEICGGKPVNWAHELPQCDYPERRDDPSNGHTLCRSCHSFFHYNNFSRYWCADMDMVVEWMKTQKRSYKKYDKPDKSL